MKKVLTMALAVLISVAFVSVTFAQAPEKTETTTTTTKTPFKKETTTTTTKTTKSKHMEFTGKVMNMDTAENMMTVQGKKGDMTFDVSTATMKGEAKVGDNVLVKYIEKDGKMVASSVTVKWAKTTKKTTTTKETTEETTAPASQAK